MKYGDTLRQRSIPEWRSHNIDYQDIKYFIKLNTTPGKGKAVAIPGKNDANAEDFENKLFVILKEQDERITWFVKSKVGEIQRRLGHLEHQIERAVARVSTPEVGRETVKRAHRYGKIETDLLKVGEEIQALSRFVGVQLEAFRKLIKKYKKWTGSSELGYRFDAEVRQHDNSFASTDLKPLLHIYEELLHATRTLYQRRNSDSTRVQHDIDAQGVSLSPSRFREAKFVLENGKRVDFDNLLATLDIAESGREAVFWVHPENLVELQILLQQYTESFNALCRRPSVASARSGRSTPTSPAQEWRFNFNQQDTFDVIADDAQRYLSDRASLTVNAVHARSQTAALHARAALENDVSLLTWTPTVGAKSTEIKTCALKRKFVNSVLDPNRQVLSRKASVTHLSAKGAAENPEESVEELQGWLKSNRHITPIVAVVSQRARFYRVPQSLSGVVMAALDQSIQFQSGVSTQPDTSAVDFPYAVLSIRQEGAQIIDLIRILDNSHLVERIHGFSLEYHAIWQATQPEGISAPFWIPLLSQDLRKLPQARPHAARKQSTEFGSQSTTPRASTATSSEADGLAEQAKGNKSAYKKYVPDLAKVKRKSVTLKDPKVNKASERYWNEYDDPSDDEQDYVLYIDPNYESWFEKSWKKFKQAFGTKKEAAPETEALLYSPDLESGSGSQEDLESSDDDVEPPNYRISRIYGHGDAVGKRTSASDAISCVPKLPLACFAASLSILLVAFILAATGKKKLHTEVDVGVIFSIVTSLTFAIAGVASLYRSGAQLRGIIWVLAGTVLSIVAIASGGLLAWMLT